MVAFDLGHESTRSSPAPIWIDAIAVSSRSAISRLVASSRRERAVSPSSAAAKRVRSTPSLHLGGETLFVAVSVLSPFNRGIERVERERQTPDGSIDCALLRHLPLARIKNSCGGRYLGKESYVLRDRTVNAWRTICPAVFVVPVHGGSQHRRTVTLTQRPHMLSTRQKAHS